jgi:hypothetical protein
MAKKSSNVVNLATGNKRRKVAKEKETETVVDDKDQKAKETVENLLKDVPMDLKKQELLELDEDATDEKSVEWLTEQLSTLGEENEKLRERTATAEGNYEKLFKDYQKLKESKPVEEGGEALVPDSLIKRNVLALFEEVQRNMLGMNQNRTPYKNMSTRHLLMKMLNLFPFTKDIQKF